jgi:hypothetical protein
MRPAVNMCIVSVSMVRINGVASLATASRGRSRADILEYSNEAEAMTLAGKLF